MRSVLAQGGNWDIRGLFHIAHLALDCWFCDRFCGERRAGLLQAAETAR